MGTLQRRVDAYTNMSANLITQLNELDQLRERVRKLSLRLANARKRRARRSQRALAPNANWRSVRQPEQ
jgi:hypothetical protein